MEQDKALRKQLIDLLNGGLAYEPSDEILKSIRPEERGTIPQGAEHSAWQILDHMVQSLEDIVQFSDNANGKYEEKPWPDGYWSKENNGDWEKSVRALKSARREMEKLINDPKRDLFERFPWGDGQTLLKEALVAADHVSYHLGEIVELQRWLTQK
jgi:hypothetical protein